MPRGVSSAIITELDKPAFEAPIYALRISRESTDLYWAERVVTIDGQAYEARLINVDGFEQSAGSASQFTITAGNVDGAITILDRAESFAGCRCEVLEYLPTLNVYSVRAVGYLDEVTEMTPESATIPATVEHTGNTLVGLPKRSLSASCPHHFANTANYVNVRDFEGSECPYQRVSTIGFRASLQDTLDAVTDPVTFTVNWADHASGAKAKATDQIVIDSERMLITAAADPSGGGDQDITVTRGYNGSTMAAHSVSPATFVYFANCQFSDSACIRRGMFGNNSVDTFSGTPRNYFGGFPLITGTQWGFFRTKQGEKPSPQRLNFSGNESAYGLALGIPYGKVRISDPVLMLAIGEGDFLTTYWVVSEGLLATNASDDTQTTRANAYTGGASNEQIYVNGVSRHDRRPGYGIELWNGQMDQDPPSSIWFPGTYPDEFNLFFLGFNASAWCVLRINTRSNPSVDVTGQQITGVFTVEYGRVVRVYTSTSPVTYTRKATTNPAWVAFDIRTAKRVGAGVDSGRMNIQSYIDVAAYNAQTVATTDEEAVDTPPRWTFNGVFDQKRSFAEWERLVCLGMYCIPPFIGADGKYKIKSLKAETLSGLPVLSSLLATDSRNILWEPGEDGVERSSLVRLRKSILEIPNQIQATFIDKATFTKLNVIVADRDAQEDLGSKLGDQSRRVIEKTYSLPGTSTMEEAARWATLVLRCGEFAEGGLANNNGVRCKMFYRGAINLELGDVVEFHDEQLDAANGEQFYRITRIGDETTQVNEGGFLFVREIEAWIHDNAMYDDGAFTVTHFERLTGAPTNDQEPPAVTGFSISEAGALDGNGQPVSRLTINYTEPNPIENYRSLTIWKSNDDGGSPPAPVGDWRFIGEVLTTGETITVENTGTTEWFAAVSRANSGHHGDIDTLTSAGTKKYPRVSILVDGYTDTSVADAPTIGVVRSQAQLGTSRYEMTIGVDSPGSPSFWKTAYQTEIQITTDNTFVSFPTGKSLNAIYNWVPPNSIEFSTNFPGTYYMRARVYNVQGPGTWSSTLTRSTDFLDGLTNDTDLVAGLTPTATAISGEQFKVEFDYPGTNDSTAWGYSIYGYTSSTLPTATTQDTGTAGAVTAGSNVLTDLTKAWSVNAYAGKDVVLFDTHRSGTESFSYEGMFIVCQILSNTATTITFDAPVSQVRRTMSAMEYYVVNRGAGHHFWEKLTFTTAALVDETITAPNTDTVEPRPKHKTVYINSTYATMYIWVAVYNAFGQGRVTASPATLTFGGTVTSTIKLMSVDNGQTFGQSIITKASFITAGVITGATVRTNAGNSRTEMNTTDGLMGVGSGGSVHWRFPLNAAGGMFVDQISHVQADPVYGTPTPTAGVVIFNGDQLSFMTCRQSAAPHNKPRFLLSTPDGTVHLRPNPSTGAAQFYDVGTAAYEDIPNATSAVAEPNTQIVYGTGAGLDSSANLVYNGTNVTLTGGSFVGSGASLTSLNASNLASGTVPDARFPATLPALSGVNLTSLNASNLASGTVPDARFPSTLPALNGSALTSLNASSLASGTVNDARLSTAVVLYGGSAINGNVSFNDGFGIANGSGEAWALSNTGGLVGYSNSTEVVRINDAATKLYIGGVYYTLSVVAGIVNAA